MGSTNFLALGRLSAKVLEEKEPKILVLITDGGDAKALKGFGDIIKSRQNLKEETI